MARRKSNAEVGPLGVWAYETRIALDLSVEGVVVAIHYHPATLRKVEGGSVLPSARMWRELGNLYNKLADERRIAIDPQPRLREESATVGSPGLAQVLANLTEELAALRLERIALWRGVTMALASPAGAHVAAALRDALAPLLPESVPQ